MSNKDVTFLEEVYKDLSQIRPLSTTDKSLMGFPTVADLEDKDLVIRGLNAIIFYNLCFSYLSLRFINRLTFSKF